MRAGLIGLVLFALAAPAQATTLVLPDGTERPQPYQAWVDAARAPTPPGSVLLYPDTDCPPVPERGSCILHGSDTIYLGAARNELRYTLRHELGHLFDRRVLTDAQRNRFGRLIRDRRPWRSSPNSPHEKFAEAWGACARSPRWPPRDSGYRYEPSVGTHRRVCGFIRRAATAPGPKGISASRGQ